MDASSLVKQLCILIATPVAKLCPWEAVSSQSKQSIEFNHSNRFFQYDPHTVFTAILNAILLILAHSHGNHSHYSRF
jgi:hypothetical protein